MRSSSAEELGLAAPALAFYRRTLALLGASGIPFLVGGAFALERHTGVVRRTKDLDLLVLPADCERVLQVLADDGCRTAVVARHWLGKALLGDDAVDVIFSSGNAVATVDERWFHHAIPNEVLGVPALICPAEELIWSKASVMERERFDGADVAHLLLACADRLDWARLLERFGDHWRILFAHLVLYGFSYPGERDKVPAPVMEDLMDRLHDELDRAPPDVRVCQGTILSRAQYLIDVERWGYEDARSTDARGEPLACEPVVPIVAVIKGEG